MQWLYIGQEFIERGGGLWAMTNGSNPGEGWNGIWEGGVGDESLVFIDTCLFMQTHYRR
jgi:hypothetical protein